MGKRGIEKVIIAGMSANLCKCPGWMGISGNGKPLIIAQAYTPEGKRREWISVDQGAVVLTDNRIILLLANTVATVAPPSSGVSLAEQLTSKTAQGVYAYSATTPPVSFINPQVTGKLKRLDDGHIC